MLFRNMVSAREEMEYLSDDYEDFHDNTELNKRLCKTLYYGKMPSHDRPSLAMTELAVEVLQDMAPKELGKLDIDWAAAMSRELLMSPSSVMIGMMYAKRLKKKRSKYLHQISSSDLFLVSVMMASKFLYDEGEDGVLNEEWAASVNMDVKELNELERNFLSAMDWELFVSEDEFWATLLLFERQLARRRVQETGNTTYTELLLLSTDTEACRKFNEILLQLCKVISVCVVAYTASVVLLTVSQLTVYITVSSVMSLAPTTPATLAPSTLPPTVHDQSQFTDDSVSPARCEDCTVSELAHVDTVTTGDHLTAPDSQTCVADTYWMKPLVNVLLSTLSLIFSAKPGSNNSCHSGVSFDHGSQSCCHCSSSDVCRPTCINGRSLVSTSCTAADEQLSLAAALHHRGGHCPSPNCVLNRSSSWDDHLALSDHPALELMLKSNLTNRFAVQEVF